MPINPDRHEADIILARWALVLVSVLVLIILGLIVNGIWRHSL